MYILRNLDKIEYKKLIEEFGEKEYRIKQIEYAIYNKSVSEISEIKGLSKDFIAKLDKVAKVSDTKILNKQISKDGTIKYLLGFSDGLAVEMVLMRFDNRANLTACISTQIGCKMGCSFCFTAKQGFKRNLKWFEMIDQILTIQADTGLKITNVVFMGQGEPLDNWDEVYKAIEVLNEKLEIGIRRITISTSGLAKDIKKLYENDLLPTLAISLHAPNDDIRNEIMPINKRYNMEELKKALIDFNKVTGKRVTIEYIMLDEINCEPQHAKELCNYLKDIKCNINLIPYNSGECGIYKRPSQKKIQIFKLLLEKSGKKVTQRLERGSDIQAACGQLTGKN